MAQKRNGWIALRALVRGDILIALLLLVAAPVYAGDVTLAWDPVTSASLAGYVIHYGPTAGSYPNSVDVGNVTTRTVTNLTEGATYNFVVTAYDSSRSESGPSNNVVATIRYTAPVANFSASTVSGVAPLVMNFIDQSTGSITTYAWAFGDGTTSTSQNPSKSYTNAGTYSVALTVTGPGGSNVKTKPNYITVTAQVNTTPPSAPASTDTTPPSTPGSLTSTANGSTGINLSWAASTDNVGVTGYRVERCQGASCRSFTQIATPSATSFSDSGLSAGTTYRYRVRATDAAGNVSGYSNTSTTATGSAGALPIAYVQGNYATPQSPQPSVSVTYKGPQTAGSLNVVVVGWNDTTAVVNAVTDSKGNVYTRAVGPTAVAGLLSQSIYYAKNIAAATANANTVTVQFNVAAKYADIRILEYRGLDPANPVDVTASGAGSSATSSTAAVTTTNANDLIFGANMVYTVTAGPGTGFTSRLITTPDGDIAEDRIVTTTGSYSATAPLSPAGSWVMQLVAFRGL